MSLYNVAPDLLISCEILIFRLKTSLLKFSRTVMCLSTNYNYITCANVFKNKLFGREL